jgi:hypothetical protein
VPGLFGFVGPMVALGLRSRDESRGPRNLVIVYPQAGVSLSPRREAMRKDPPSEVRLHLVVGWFTRPLEPNDPCGERIQEGPLLSFLDHEPESRSIVKKVRRPPVRAGVGGERGLHRHDPNRRGVRKPLGSSGVRHGEDDALKTT